MNYSIETANLSKTFTHSKKLGWPCFSMKKEKTIAVNSVSLKIQKGEFFGLVGPNSSGKTIFLKLLATLIPPTDGKAYVNGYSVTENTKKVRESIGLLTSESRSFYWQLTGRQNLVFFAGLKQFSLKDASRKIDQLASLLEIERYLDRRFLEYSSGIKQRLSIARCLLGNPQVLLLDEPMKSLDTKGAQYLRTLFKKRLINNDDKTILFTSHSYQEAEILADRLATIEDGLITFCGSPGDKSK
ncbi:ABC transporter ATP-binding protein [bacterium]|nr:ABC transporter ATP-binding protein [bacterium]